MKKRLYATFVLAVVGLDARAADWPQFRADADRSGFTGDRLPTAPTLAWTYHPRHPPAPAWRAADTRMPFDHAYHVVIADGRLFFGSSADGKVYALDAATGLELWSFQTDAPVRFAPAVWKDQVFVASDDGHLYCLSAVAGTLGWTRLGGPDDGMVLGNGRMISRWPARGGPVVRDGMVYFAAGIWPSERIFLYALDAATGQIVWLNDRQGGIEMNQPHKGARARSGVSAQGYLAAARDHLVVPTGRAVPAVFDRSTGTLRYFHLQDNGHLGGAAIVTADPYMLNSDAVWRIEDGSLAGDGATTAALAIRPDCIVFARGPQVIGVERATLVVEKEVVDRKGNKTTRKVLNTPSWTIANPGIDTPAALIVAGPDIVVGGRGRSVHRVTLLDGVSRSVRWTTEVDGMPHGLAVADGRLYVSTDRGTIYCFSDQRSEAPAVLQPAPLAHPFEDNAIYASAAEEIIRETGVTDGYCVDLGCGEGRLAYELARRTRLVIVAIDADVESVARARRALDAAGQYGVRVTVHHGDPARTPYPPYFANLVVSGRSVTQGPDVVSAGESRRVQRPFGGVACVGKPGAMAKSVRGGLEGSGGWTHQYADAANTSCSTDALVKGPLGMLWFTDNDFVMPSRHGRGPAPLFSQGRLFVEGLDGLRAIDAYNGRVLWDYPLPGILRAYDQEHLVGAAGTGSNFCVGDDGVYVRTGDRCLRLDAASGKKLAELPTPLRPDGRPGAWGYIAWVRGTIFGSLADEEHLVKWTFGRSDMAGLFTESCLLFALDADTGRPKWTYRPQHSIRNNTIAIAGGRVYFIDRRLALEDRLGADEAAAARRGLTTRPRAADQRVEGSGTSPAGAQAPAVLLALDAQTGAVLWKKDHDIFGTLLAVSAEHDVLLMTYQDTRFKLPSEVGGRMAALRASNGQSMWARTVARPQGYGSASRPVITGRTVYLEPFAYDLLTGEPKQVDDPATGACRPWQFARSYGCGALAASAHLIVFRSATLGYLDLLRDGGTESYGGLRPACWINALPAGGLVLVPDATTRCTCSYLIKASIALQPMAE